MTERDKETMNHMDNLLIQEEAFYRREAQTAVSYAKGPSNEEEIIWPQELFVVSRNFRIAAVSRMSFLLRHASRVPVL